MNIHLQEQQYLTGERESGIADLRRDSAYHVEAKIQVQTVDLKAQNGKHIRKVSRVILEDGRQITFVEKLSAKDAIKQARAAVEGDSTRTKWTFGSIC